VSQRVVIDASVAAASGDTGATHPVSKLCRDLLSEVLRICHKMVWTSAIREEWDRHQSRFARTFRTQMFARRKVAVVDDVDDPALLKKIEKTATSGNKVQQIRDDFHLLRAARAADGIVLSLDEEARGLFREAAKNVGEVRDIAWINPASGTTEAINWLGKDIRQDKRYALGSV